MLFKYCLVVIGDNINNKYIYSYIDINSNLLTLLPRNCYNINTMLVNILLIIKYPVAYINEFWVN